MTTFQHPAEQDAAADAFLTPNVPYPPYQYSVFLNGNRNEQLVVRAATFEELLAHKRHIQRLVQATANNHASAQAGESQAACQHVAFRTQVVKKAGDNQGRQFKVCTQCDKFLGFM